MTKENALQLREKTNQYIYNRSIFDAYLRSFHPVSRLIGESAVEAERLKTVSNAAEDDLTALIELLNELEVN
jgi:hypothetical protein